MSKRPLNLLNSLRPRLSQRPQSLRRPFTSRANPTTSRQLNGRIIAGVGLVAISAAGYTLTTQNPTKLDARSVAELDERTKREDGITEQSPMRLRMEQFIREQQREIVAALEQVDGKRFREDTWARPNGGGGLSCVLQEGNVFEKAGVNISVVYGTLPKAAVSKMRENHKSVATDEDQLDFYALGLSLVLHPRNPMAPTVHLNYRYFETMRADGSSQAWWFGGGSDLTPSYLFDEDAVHFHRTLKEACDKHDKDYYPRFKKWCDEYFSNKHRGESRGVGGIFFDDLDDTVADSENTFSFIQDCLKSFLPSYIPIIEKRKEMPFTEKEKEWQQVRRGRYVEFNLVHDRGTAFGLNVPGSRVESILMSLPLSASWRYMYEPEPRSREQRLIDVLKNPKEWHGYSVMALASCRQRTSIVFGFSRGSGSVPYTVTHRAGCRQQSASRNTHPACIATPTSIIPTMKKHFIPLESNPELFTELIHRLGVSKNLAFFDLLTLSASDTDLLSFIPRPAHALILVIPAPEGYAKELDEVVEKDIPLHDKSGDEEDAVFYRQTIGNACGLFAILHAVSNGDTRKCVEPDSYIDKLISRCAPLKREERIAVLESDDQLEAAHASVASRGDTAPPPDPTIEVEHAYMTFTKSSKTGRLYQLEGCRKGPIDLGVALDDGEDMLSEKALTAVKKFVEEAGKGDDWYGLGYSAMALCVTEGKD
ncbi:Coproporphyrinogen III oxidase [Xylariaceae sp. FL1272]|nr:Coproporphyrinogen III oxidase [Xylariaceae sp. FL1272]